MPTAHCIAGGDSSHVFQRAPHDDPDRHVHCILERRPDQDKHKVGTALFVCLGKPARSAQIDSIRRANALRVAIRVVPTVWFRRMGGIAFSPVNIIEFVQSITERSALPAQQQVTYS